MSDGPPPATPEPPGRDLTRPSFVGREAELQQVQSAFDAAAAGHGSLAAVLGEPGIGKTSLCDQLARYATSQGGRVLVGHCYEAAPRPYLPFVEALRSYVLERDAEELRHELGASAGDVARLLAEVSDRLGIEPSVSTGDGEDDRYRLLEAITEFLRSAAQHQPIVLVLEDLHDADHGTLDLLVHLARRLVDTGLLVVGTYRDVEVERAHPLSAALAELRRSRSFVRVHLRGLSPDDVQRLLASTSQQTIPRPFAELVHRRTDGNPLFAHELLRFVVEEGLVERRAGALRRVGEESIAPRIPEGLRDVVGKRLSRLSASTNQVLRVAAVIGREFPLEVLRHVHAGADEELEDALEEAVAAAIVEERSATGVAVTYRFSHAFFRQTLYDEMIAPRRIRLHQQIARVLEELYARRPDEHAAELAEHYAFSSETADLVKAVHYGQLAARRATDVFAYGEAAYQLDRALQVQDLADPDDAARCCDLLLELGEALGPLGNTERAIRNVAPEALSLAERLMDPRRSFRACRLALESLDAQGGALYHKSPEYLEWAERAHWYAEPAGIEAAEADLALARAWAARDRLNQARELRLHALALGRQYRDFEIVFRSAFPLMNKGAPQHWNERASLAMDSTAWPRDGVSTRAQALVLWSAASIRLAEGDRAGAAELWRQLEDLAERTHVATATLFMPQRDAILALIDGRLEQALALVERWVTRADELGAPLRGRGFSWPLLCSLSLWLGRPQDTLTAFQEFEARRESSEWRPFGSEHLNVLQDAENRQDFLRAELTRRGLEVVIASLAVCLVDLGRQSEAHALAGPLLDEEAARTGVDDRNMDLLTLMLQAAIALEHREAARALAAQLACVAHLATGDWVPTCLVRHLGAAASLNGDRMSARAYYGQALQSAGKIGFRPEIALTHLQLAELLLEEADGSGAIEHLDLAIPELRDMGMQPALERALALVPSAKDQPASDSTVSDNLTPREREVVILLAAGRSNREIAEALVITEGTAEVHVKRILGKLGLRSRAHVAAWAAEHGRRTSDKVA